MARSEWKFYVKSQAFFKLDAQQLSLVSPGMWGSIKAGFLYLKPNIKLQAQNYSDCVARIRSLDENGVFVDIPLLNTHSSNLTLDQHVFAKINHMKQANGIGQRLAIPVLYQVSGVAETYDDQKILFSEYFQQSQGVVGLPKKLEYLTRMSELHIQFDGVEQYNNSITSLLDSTKRVLFISQMNQGLKRSYIQYHGALEVTSAFKSSLRWVGVIARSEIHLMPKMFACDQLIIEYPNSFNKEAKYFSILKDTHLFHANEVLFCLMSQSNNNLGSSLQLSSFDVLKNTFKKFSKMNYLHHFLTKFQEPTVVEPPKKKIKQEEPEKDIDETSVFNLQLFMNHEDCNVKQPMFDTPFCMYHIWTVAELKKEFT